MVEGTNGKGGDPMVIVPLRDPLDCESWTPFDGERFAAGDDEDVEEED